MSEVESRIIIRFADSADVEVVDSHRAESRIESKKYRGAPLTRTVHPTWTIVAVVGSTIVGSLDVTLEPNDRADISHVFVIPEAREIGIGDSLMSFALTHLRTHGVTRVESSAQPGDRALKNLFERHGLVAQTIIVGKSLSDPSNEEHASR